MEAPYLVGILDGSFLVSVTLFPGTLTRYKVLVILNTLRSCFVRDRYIKM